MKKLVSFLLGLFVIGMAYSQTETLTFRVDMNQQAVSPDGVHVAGDWQEEAGFGADWQPGASAMDDSDEDGIYELTVEVPAGIYAYKFLNGNAWGTDENAIPSECNVGGNRSVEVASGGTTTDAVCFGTCEVCQIVGSDVTLTLQVDMSQVASVDAGGVSVGGTFNGFSPQLMNDQGNGIWSLDVTVASGSTVLWKYINGPDFGTNTSIENVPSDCGQDDGFGGFNRVLVAPEADAALGPVCYSSCEACSDPGVFYELTLLVDASQLAEINAAGLHAAGTFNSFSPDAMVDEGGGLFSYTTSVEEGSTVLWKYINGPTFDDEVESVPGECGQDDGFGGFNRVLTMPSADTTAGPVCFSQCVACEVAPENYDLTLIVDASDLDEVNPNGGIHVAGTFNSFSPTAMNDDGDGVYSITVSVAEGSTVLYKFLNSSDFSAAEEVPEACGEDDGFGGFNRILTMPSADTTAGPVCFGSCEACPTAPPCELPYPQVDGLSFSNENGGVLLSWNPIEGAIGCQLQFQLPDGTTATRIKPGANASQFFIPGNFLVNGGTYNWRVRCGCSTNPLVVGPFSPFSSFAFFDLSGLAENPSTTLRAVPNPSNGQTFISLNTTIDASQASVEVYDLSGRLVRQVYNGNVASNQEMRFQFDGSDLPEGIYLIRYTSNSEVTTEKMMISK